jgi:hypothetical protein
VKICDGEKGLWVVFCVVFFVSLDHQFGEVCDEVWDVEEFKEEYEGMVAVG